MADFQIVLVDHYSDWSNLRPLTLTRPVSHLRVGILRIFEKWEHFFKQKVQVKSCVDYLQSMSNFSPNTQEAFCYINSTILPTPELCGAIQNLKAGDSLYADGILFASMVNPTEGHFENEIHFDGEIIRIEKPWTVFQQNEKAIALDFAQITKGRKSQTLDAEANLIVGKESLQRIFVEEGAEVNGAILSPKNGYIYVGKNAEIMEGAVVRGSLAMCEGAVLKLAAKIYGATTIGPYSKVGGEVNNSVIQGYSNKGHDGFLGNSVLGEWCNLGADTNNSNLKNNYGNVKAWSYEKEEYIDSGLQFLGLIMGDHSKCGINTMFNTGTVAGVFANVFGGDFPPKYIPSFAWGGANGFSTYRLEKALEVARVVMARRNKELSKEDEQILTYLFEKEQA